MSDLEATRDHARAMAERTVDPRDRSNATSGTCSPRLFTDPLHSACQWEECSCSCHPRHVPTDSERALWAQIADEIDAYLTPEDDGPGLFGEVGND